MEDSSHTVTSDDKQGAPALGEKVGHLVTASIESIAKTLVLSVAALYTLGLVVTNQYLISINSSDFTSLQPKCAITGAWSLALVVVSALPALMFFLSWSLAERYSHSEKVRQLLVRSAIVCAGVGLGVALAIFGLNSVISLLRVPADPALVPLKDSLCLDVSASVGFLGAIWGFVRLLPPKIFKIALVIYVALCLYFAAHVSQSLGYIYGEVPQALAGGRPLHAALIFNQNGVAFWRDIGGDFSSLNNGSKRSVEVEVLFQDRDYFVIRLLGLYVVSRTQVGPIGNVPSLSLPSYGDIEDRIIVLNKSLVDGVITHEESLSELRPRGR
jgi:hypothetical protein